MQSIWASTHSFTFRFMHIPYDSQLLHLLAGNNHTAGLDIQDVCIFCLIKLWLFSSNVCFLYIPAQKSFNRKMASQRSASGKGLGRGNKSMLPLFHGVFTQFILLYSLQYTSVCCILCKKFSLDLDGEVCNCCDYALLPVRLWIRE